MKISHISNSFLVVETIDAKIVCDPWVGHGNHGGWQSFPDYDPTEINIFISNANFVYISHLHSDHFDPAFLVSSGLVSNCTFLIKKFDNGVLFKRLKAIGVQNIIELNSLTDTYITEKTRITIIPQLTSNSSNFTDSVNYDLDTSIVISSNGLTFFNHVDNPLSNDNFIFIKNYINSIYGNINVGCFVCGAASEYPQCFRKINREQEKKKIISSSLVSLKSILEIMRPDYYFLAGGTYVIPGEYHFLNSLIAQPSDDEVRLFCNGISTFIRSNSEFTIERSDDGFSRISSVSPLSKQTLDEAIISHSTDKYDFQSSFDYTLAEVSSHFEMAKNNFHSIIQSRRISLSTNISFHIYDQFSFDKNLIISSPPLKVFNLISDFSDTLIIHIDKKLFHGCLTRKFIWNQALSGSLCLFDRQPNIHKVEDLFSMNFLTV